MYVYNFMLYTPFIGIFGVYYIPNLVAREETYFEHFARLQYMITANSAMNFYSTIVEI